MSKKEHIDSCHFVVLDPDGVNRHNCSVKVVGRRRQLEGLLRDIRYGVDSPEPRRIMLLSGHDLHI